MRNKDHIGYYPPIAQENRKKRRAQAKALKIDGFPELKAYIIEKLRQKWSPRIIAGRWKLQHKGIAISAEAIYQWIYSPEGQRLELHKLLIRQKRKRGFTKRTRKTNESSSKTPIAERPEAINNRQESGHYEADLMFNQGSQSSNVLTVVERTSRYATLVKNESKRAEIVCEALQEISRKQSIKSLTFDNGPEFSRHQDLTQEHGIKTYFCLPGHPWEKGAIEHLNGMLRAYIPFKVDSSSITQEQLNEIAYSINHKPRQILGFLNPCEVFNGVFQAENTQCCTS